MSNPPHVECLVDRARKLHPSEGYTNSVNVIVDTIYEEFVENTGIQTLTGRSNPVPICFNINVESTSHDHILWLLHNNFNSTHGWTLYEELASFISVTATDLGFGFNGFTVDILVKITYQSVVVLSDHPPSINHNHGDLSLKALRTVLLGKVNREDLKNLKTETELCSICLDDLSDSSKHDGAPTPTRMTCSHVFHVRCLLEWLYRKNTCPLCRTVLYAIDDLEQ